MARCGPLSPHGTRLRRNEIAIVNEIKRTLRERGITYEQVAKHMKLSHASIKRLFASSTFTLERIDQICEFLGLELTDLVEQMKDREAPVTRLTVAQEKDIVSDMRLFLMTWLILNRWRVEEIMQAFRFNEREMQQYLIKLRSARRSSSCSREIALVCASRPICRGSRAGRCGGSCART